MKKRIFQILAIVGVIIICILAFIIPKDPFKIMPALSMMSFDKPVWLNIIIDGCGVYLITLGCIYERFNK